MTNSDINKERRAAMLACAQELSRIAPRLFDQPDQTITLMKRIIDRHGVHASEVTMGVGRIDEVRELRQEVNELMAAQVRQYDTFETACASKGYVGEKALAEMINVEPAQIRNWKAIGRVPAIFFYKIAVAPDLAVAKQQALHEKELLREATRRAKKQMQEAAKQAFRKRKELRKLPSIVRNYDQEKGNDPELYARAQTRFVELGRAAIQAGAKRVNTARISDEVNRELGANLSRIAIAQFSKCLRADLLASVPTPITIETSLALPAELLLQAAE